MSDETRPARAETFWEEYGDEWWFGGSSGGGQTVIVLPAKRDDGSPVKAVTGGDAQEQEAARRLAECWNACAGLPTSALESGALALVLDFATKHATAELDSSLGALQPGDEVYEALRALGRLP